jgi:hypothetical protein
MTRRGTPRNSEYIQIKVFNKKGEIKPGPLEGNTE